MNRFLLILIMVFGSVYGYAGEPLIDEHQLIALSAHDKVWSDCNEERINNKDSRCHLKISLGQTNDWPIPKRGTKEYCKQQYANLSVDELEGKSKEIETVYETARYFPMDSSAEPERGEITKGDLNVEIQCISDYIKLKQ
jgi:hypothetical protein